ncbi:hypothetical protein VNO78_01339 [Psophocarpus tetragonolobus]|uniref:Uncharacterized protein n=1 Tax=Psophocarpus tetragonolobus TaxID=3891 RepID=A0AAN9SXW2_PSOTE
MHRVVKTIFLYRSIRYQVVKYVGFGHLWLEFAHSSMELGIYNSVNPKACQRKKVRHGSDSIVYEPRDTYLRPVSLKHANAKRLGKWPSRSSLDGISGEPKRQNHPTEARNHRNVACIAPHAIIAPCCASSLSFHISDRRTTSFR